ncbi:MAG: trypsin-like serine protease [Deltaproteobacteria bacterium]|jgi:MYXO-CTERM domain-containing protein|nr:trypsin-like serine protease [Deltaproteobacteria bacterium]MBW2536221.1 trypsin-like serine protease [Deltaproteobacteria bacterium]
MRLAPLSLVVSLAAAAGCAAPVEPLERSAAGRQPIVGGTVDDETKGAVGLAVNFLDIWFAGHCSGSLITPNVVLTAQHCVSLTEGETPAGGVVCGQTDFGLAAGGQVFRVTTETERPQADGPEFYPGANMRVRIPEQTDNLCGFDVALIVLEGAGIPSTEATPLVPRIDSPPAPGDLFSAVGYGLTAPTDGDSGTRMRIDDNVVSCVGASCGSQIYDTEWRGDAPTCPGDSGGPAIDAEGRVMGVLSRGPSGCISSVYGDVSSWRDLLIDTAVEAAELGGIEPPFWALTGESTPPPPAGAGQTCLGICVAGHTCATTEDGSRRCVPTCDADAPACPEGMRCDGIRGACLDDPAYVEEDSGCTTASPAGPSAAPPTWWLVLVALGARRRRRR